MEIPEEHSVDLRDKNGLAKFVFLSNSAVIRIPQLEIEFEAEEKKLTVVSDIVYVLTKTMEMLRDSLGEEEDGKQKAEGLVATLKKCLKEGGEFDLVIEDKEKLSKIFEEELGSK